MGQVRKQSVKSWDRGPTDDTEDIRILIATARTALYNDV